MPAKTLFLSGLLILGSSLMAFAASPASQEISLWFREDFTETPPETPVQQKHLSNPDLILTRLGPGADLIKRSFHEDKPGDPHYVWSGLCEGRWGLTFYHPKTEVDLAGKGWVRWRVKQGGDRVLHLILRTGSGWLVSDQGTPASKDWIEATLHPAQCDWYQLDIVTMERGNPVPNPDLDHIREVGFTDLQPGGKSQSCSRLDWIEVHGVVRAVTQAGAPRP